MKSFNLCMVSLALIISFNDCSAAYKKHVIGVGAAVFDIYVECLNDEELYEYTNGITVKKGDSIDMDRSFAQRLAKNISYPSKQQAGGSVANVITGIASLGGNVAMVTARANDLQGHSFDQDLAKLKVEHFCTIIENAETSVVYSFITPDGERTMLAHFAESLMINPDDFQIDRIKNYQMLLSNGYMWYSKDCAQMMQKKFSEAHEAGVTTVFSLSSPHFVATFKEQFIKLLPNLDIVVGNEEEFCCLCDTKNLDDVYSAMQDKVTMAVITLAEQGAAVVTKDQIIHVPVQDIVTTVVDTTGAGDMFLAGFLYGQTHGMDIKKSAHLGNALAGRLIQQIGARPEFDTREILNSILI